VRVSCWIKFIDKVPSKSYWFGFDFDEGKRHNDWVDQCKPDEWTWVSSVAKLGTSDIAVIFNTVEGPQTIRMSKFSIEMFDEKP